MTDVYRIVASTGSDECFLLCGQAPGESGLYAASVLYWHRTEEETVPSVTHFTSQDLTDAEAQAEAWIRANLFPGFAKRPFREV